MTVNAYVAPAPVIDYIAPPPPAVIYLSFSQQLPPDDINEAGTVEASAPQDVGSLLSVDELTLDILFPRCVEEMGEVSVQLGTHAIDECVQDKR